MKTNVRLSMSFKAKIKPVLPEQFSRDARRVDPRVTKCLDYVLKCFAGEVAARGRQFLLHILFALFWHVYEWLVRGNTIDVNYLTLWSTKLIYIIFKKIGSNLRENMPGFNHKD